MLPPGVILVLRLPPTPTFFLYKKPGKPIDLPYQNCPFEYPEPKADEIYIIYIYTFYNKINKSGAKTKNNIYLINSQNYNNQIIIHHH